MSYAPQGSQNQNLKNAPELNFFVEDNGKKVYSYIFTYMPSQNWSLTTDYHDIPCNGRKTILFNIVLDYILD